MSGSLVSQPWVVKVLVMQEASSLGICAKNCTKEIRLLALCISLTVMKHLDIP